MLEGITATVVLQAGAFGLLLIVLMSLFVAVRSGQLVPKATMDKLTEIMNGRAERAEQREDQWRQIAEDWRNTAHLATEQAAELLEQGRLTVDLLQAIKEAQDAQDHSYVGVHHRRRR